MIQDLKISSCEICQWLGPETELQHGDCPCCGCTPAVLEGMTATRWLAILWYMSVGWDIKEERTEDMLAHHMRTTISREEVDLAKRWLHHEHT